jgi:hypothetical protein
MKQTLIKGLFVFAFLSFIISCSRVPDWYEETPSDNNYLYAARSAVSKDMQFALEKATMEARAEIGRQVSTKIEELQKRFIQEIGDPGDKELGKSFAIATKAVVNTTLNGSKVLKKKFVKEDKHWRAYVLVVYPIGKAHREFLKNIVKDDALLQKVKSTQLFNDLKKEAGE